MKILIIDDDLHNREILRARLEQAGYEVIEAENGDKGIEAANEQAPDAIVLDVMMPKKDGWATCKALKGDAKTRNMPVIMLTALNQPIDELRGWECGVDEFLSKPVDHEKLIASVKRLMIKNILDDMEKL